MPSTCIFTKLKGAINAQDLPIFGACNIKFRVTNNTMQGLFLGTTAAVTITTDSPVTILVGGTEFYPSGTSFNVDKRNFSIKPVTANQDVKVTIGNKYAIKGIGTIGGVHADGIELMDDCTFLTALTEMYSNSGGIFDIDLFKDSPQLAIINLTSASKTYGSLDSIKGDMTRLVISGGTSSLTGDVSDISFASNIGNVSFPASNQITGQISHFYGLDLGNLSVGGTNVAGVLEDYLEQWYGLTTRTVITMSMGQNITFHEASIAPGGNWNGRADISGGVLTLKNASNVVLATYDGSTWTYV